MHMARVSMIVFGAMALVDQLIIQINLSKGSAFTTAIHRGFRKERGIYLGFTLFFYSNLGT